MDSLTSVNSKDVKNGVGSFIEKNFLALAILVTGALIAGSIFFTNGDSDSSDVVQQPGVGQGDTRVDVSVDDDAFLGNKNAKVTVIEFSDYQCPFCRTFWKDTFGQLKKDYMDTGKIKFVYRDYPLGFHPSSHISAEASECAEDEGKYWEMHNKIFAEQEKKGQGTISYTADDLKQWASEIGLNKTKFAQCLDSSKYKAEVDRDLADGSAAGVTGTPSFFINGRLIVGAQPYSAFKAIIEDELDNK